MNSRDEASLDFFKDTNVDVKRMNCYDCETCKDFAGEDQEDKLKECCKQLHKEIDKITETPFDEQ